MKITRKQIRRIIKEATQQKPSTRALVTSQELEKVLDLIFSKPNDFVQGINLAWQLGIIEDDLEIPDGKRRPLIKWEDDTDYGYQSVAASFTCEPWFIKELKKRDRDFGLDRIITGVPYNVRRGVYMSRRTGDKYSRM